MTNYHIGYPNSDDSSTINPPIEQGSTYELDFTVTLPAAIMAKFTTPNTVALRASYRTSLDSSTKTDFTTCTVSATSATVLTCKIVMSSVTTATLSAGRGYWDCELYNTEATPYVFKPLGSGNKAKVVGEATK